MKKLLDYRETGGTPLLGVRKPVLKIHGESDELAFKNAVNQAMGVASANIAQELEDGLKLLAAKESGND